MQLDLEISMKNQSNIIEKRHKIDLYFYFSVIFAILVQASITLIE